jgi:hypothetical protein
LYTFGPTQLSSFSGTASLKTILRSKSLMGHLAIKLLASQPRKLMPGTRKVPHLLLNLSLAQRICTSLRVCDDSVFFLEGTSSFFSG